MVPGDKGEHVKLIQQALIQIDGVVIAETELAASQYGKTTADAVLAYKTKRSIINRAYQQQPDNIVGKMTIKSLDDEMQRLEAQPIEVDFGGGGLRPVRGRLI